MYLLWTALNGVVLIYLVAAGVYALQAIWQRLGVGALLVLLFGLYAWGSSAQPPVVEARTSPHEVARATRAGVPNRLFVPIENHYLNELALATTYWEPAAATALLPSHVYFTGFRLGNTWHCRLADVRLEDKRLIYNVYGTMDWCLLGVALYQEHKHLQGVVPVR